jgi:hypothetical protein
MALLDATPTLLTTVEGEKSIGLEKRRREHA